MQSDGNRRMHFRPISFYLLCSPSFCWKLHISICHCVTNAAKRGRGLFYRTRVKLRARVIARRGGDPRVTVAVFRRMDGLPLTRQRKKATVVWSTCCCRPRPPSTLRARCWSQRESLLFVFRLCLSDRVERLGASGEKRPLWQAFDGGSTTGAAKLEARASLPREFNLSGMIVAPGHGVGLRSLRVGKGRRGIFTRRGLFETCGSCWLSLDRRRSQLHASMRA